MGSSASKSPSQNKIKIAKDSHSQGSKLLSQNKIKPATAAFKKAYKADPSNVENLEDLAYVLRVQDEFPMLIEVGRAIIERQSANAEAKLHLGGDLLAYGETEEAVALFRQVISLDPNNDQVYDVLAVACSTLGRYAEALTALQTSAKMFPDRALVHSNMGVALTFLDRDDEAIQAFQHALKLDPNLPEAMAGLGDLYHHKGRNEEAIVLMKKVVEEDPENSKAWKLLGNALKAVGRHAESKEAFIKMLRLTIEDPAQLAKMEKEL